MRAEADALVVGAGPGGLAAALALRRAGAEVLLVEARDRVGHPIRCGEIVLERVFEVWGLEPRPGWIRRRIWLRDRNDEKREVLTIDRARVEFDIAGEAARRGVEVAVGTSAVGIDPFDGERRRVALRSRAGTRYVSARCVIAADGVSSAVARMAGMDAFLGPDEVASSLACMVEGAILEDPDMLYMKPLPAAMAPPPCYYWVAPGGPGSANVGLALPGRDGNRARRLLDIVRRDDRMCRGGRVVETVGGLLPGKPPLLRPFDDGLLVVGGAARMVHPVSGAGILFAATSGREAAKQVLSLDGKTAVAHELAGYRGRVQWLYGELEDGWRRLREMRREAGLTKS